MNIDSLDIPPGIKASLKTQKDILIDGFSQKGQNGYVFFAFHKILKRRVAIKFYYYGDELSREVELLAGVKHENILTVWDARTVGNGWAYFITPEIIMGDLDRHISQQTLRMDESIQIVKGILSGVGVLHNPPNSMLHRDLKPENILLNEKKVPIIADFGSVKRIKDGEDHVSGSNHAPLYRPPESYNSGRYYASSDIYQVGLILYQVVGGYLPYDEEGWLNQPQLRVYNRLTSDFGKSKFVEEVLYKKSLKGRLIKLDSLPIYVTEPYKRIIRKATNPDKDKRYSTAAEFQVELHKLGTVPSWIVSEEYLMLLGHSEKDYRVVKRKGQFICEYKPCSSDKWRKHSLIISGTQLSVVKDMIRKLI